MHHPRKHTRRNDFAHVVGIESFPDAVRTIEEIAECSRAVEGLSDAKAYEIVAKNLHVVGSNYNK